MELELCDALIIVGAGRHGRNVIDIVERQTQIAGLLDDTIPVGRFVEGVQVLGPVSRIDEPSLAKNYSWFVAIGDNAARQRFMERLLANSAKFVNVIHPSAVLSDRADIASGIYISAHCRIMPGSSVERGALIESGTHVGADARVGAYARTGVNCGLLGGTALGARSFLGSGCVIHENVSVAEDNVVGANAVVLKDTLPNARLYGLPAKPPAIPVGPR